MNVREFLQSKSFLTLIGFCGLCALFTQLESPWWEGRLLSVAVETPPGFASAQPLISFPEIDASPSIIDLSDLHALEEDNDGDDAAAEDSASSAEKPPSSDKEADDAAPQAPAFVPDRRDVALLERMRQGTQLPENHRALLTIPCRDLPRRAPDLDAKFEIPDGENAEVPSPAAIPAATPATEPQSSEDASAEKRAAPCKRYALDHFYASLRERALGRPGLTRWSQYGDSLVVGDTMTGELRRMLQRQFGYGGHGFIYMGQPLRQFGFEDIRIGASTAWEVRSVVRHSVTGGDMFGFGGVEFRAQSDSTLTIQPLKESSETRPLEHFRLLYFAPAGITEGSFRISVNGEGQNVRFPTTPSSSGMHEITIPRGDHRVVFSNFSTHLRWYGVISESAGPGVVIDNLGQVSAREEHLLKINPAQWRAQMELRAPDLVAFFYGVNGASSSAHRIGGEDGAYANAYRELLARAMAGSDTRECLVMSLLTRGTREGGGIRPTGAVTAMNAAQRAAALSSQCAFFDTTAVMGSRADATQRWAERQLLGADLAHPTAAGYREIARRLHSELMQGFIEYLERRVAGHYADAGGTTP